MNEKVKRITLVLFYLLFLVAIFCFAYFKLPDIIKLNHDSEEIKIIKDIYNKLEKNISDIEQFQTVGKRVAAVSAAVVSTDKENKEEKTNVDNISNLFASQYKVEFIYKEKKDYQDDRKLCLNRYTIFNDERIYKEKCHDLNTIEYFNKNDMFTLIYQEPTKMIYSFTTQYKENTDTVYTDYEVTLTNIDGMWKISDGLVILSNKDTEYFVYIDDTE